MCIGHFRVDTFFQRLASELCAMGRANEVGREILIPLTSSLYVPGRLTDVENVVIDVGTGYYVKKVS
jgi:prefoldin alpha subunit